MVQVSRLPSLLLQTAQLPAQLSMRRKSGGLTPLWRSDCRWDHLCIVTLICCALFSAARAAYAATGMERSCCRSSSAMRQGS